MKNRVSGGMLWIVLLCGGAVQPAHASCSGSSPIAQGGLLGLAPGSLSLPTPTADVGGFMWELGYGDPADGVGNDTSSIVSGFPVGPGDAAWIRRDPVPASIDWDWFNFGTDGCLSGGAGTGVMVAYVLDNAPAGPHYAVLAVTGTSTPSPGHDFDRIDTGDGATGSEVPLEPLSLVPELLQVTVVGSSTVSVDIAPAMDSINTHDDLGGAGPYAGLFDLSGVTELFHRHPGTGAETGIPGCVEAGCNGIQIPANHQLCWRGSVRAIGRQEPGDGTCNGGPLDGLACLPNYPGNACVLLGGTCVQAPPTVFAMGPAIPGGCTAGGAPQDSDGDGFVEGPDCDDTDPTIYPGAQQFCDARNNDCTHSSWPALPDAECFDVVNLRVSEVGQQVRLDWDIPAEGADGYQVHRGSHSDLVAGNTGGAPWMPTATNQAESLDTVGLGELSFYVVAGVRDGIQGSLGRDSLGQERVATSGP